MSDKTPLLALVLLACLAAAPAAAFAPPEDDSVRTRLEARGIEYEIDEDGDYKIVYSWKREGRSQLVYVSGTTEEIEGLRIREVFAPAARLGEDGLDPALANALLADNALKKLGAWQLSGSTLYFVVKLPDDVDAAVLETALSAAAEIADDKELELSGDADEL